MGKAVKRIATGLAVGALVTLIPGAGAYAAMAMQAGTAATVVGAVTGNKKLMQFGGDLAAIGGGMAGMNALGASAIEGGTSNFANQANWADTVSGKAAPLNVSTSAAEGMKAANDLNVGLSQEKAMSIDSTLPADKTGVIQSNITTQQPPVTSPQTAPVEVANAQQATTAANPNEALNSLNPAEKAGIEKAMNTTEPSWWSKLDPTTKALTVQTGSQMATGAIGSYQKDREEKRLRADAEKRVRNQEDYYVGADARNYARDPNYGKRGIINRYQSPARG